MDGNTCRACRGPNGHVVLDLGEQPACDYFPRQDDPGPDPVYPLQMWLCSSCGLAQLLAGCRGLSAWAVAARIQRAVSEFGSEPPSDDMAVLVIRATGE